MTAQKHDFNSAEVAPRPDTSTPITDADALGAVTVALSKSSGTTLWLDRSARLTPLELTHQGSHGTNGVHVTVWDADEDDDAPGADYVVTIRRLHRCPSHVDTFLADDGHCTHCILDQTRWDA